MVKKHPLQSPDRSHDGALHRPNVVYAWIMIAKTLPSRTLCLLSTGLYVPRPEIYAIYNQISWLWYYYESVRGFDIAISPWYLSDLRWSDGDLTLIQKKMRWDERWNEMKSWGWEVRLAEELVITALRNSCYPTESVWSEFKKRILNAYTFLKLDI